MNSSLFAGRSINDKRCTVHFGSHDTKPKISCPKYYFILEKKTKIFCDIATHTGPNHVRSTIIVGLKTKQQQQNKQNKPTKKYYMISFRLTSRQRLFAINKRNPLLLSHLLFLTMPTIRHPSFAPHAHSTQSHTGPGDTRATHKHELNKTTTKNALTIL